MRPRGGGCLEVAPLPPTHIAGTYRPASVGSGPTGGAAGGSRQKRHESRLRKWCSP
ncbi:hypothetical protein MIC448_410010 [Microbacterium sp. C448]|nr:hypothetical protein MIC448_410010 [Microbacterium sp. C448]